MKIGIPRAFLYFRYRYLWETFFNELGCEIVLSDCTNKEILSQGINYSIDESCLSSKIYMGHVYNLIGKCDYILIPRIASMGNNEKVCTKFQAAYDVVNNTFKDINILDYNVDARKKQSEFSAFMQMGKRLKKKKLDVIRSYYMAKQEEKTRDLIESEDQDKMLNNSNQIKVLLVAHSYNIYDELIGKPVIDYLKELDILPVIADLAPRDITKKMGKEISPTLPWLHNKELVGAIEYYKERIDGIILMTSFPCGPDSLVNDIIIRKMKDKPIINLILDEQEGTAGRETRIESFIDIIKIRKDEVNEKEKN